MKLSTDQGKLESSRTPSAQALLESRNIILKDWENTIRAKIKSASKLDHPVLINTVPSFIDNLVEALAEEHPRTIATESTNIAQEHGGERARLSSYGPDQLLLEYQTLRDVILETLEGQVPLSKQDRSTIQKSVDQAIREAITAFYLIHNRIREQFVASLSHDLRNPLSTAKMSAELVLVSLHSDLKTDEVDLLKAISQRIITNLKRVDRMIQDLLDTTLTQIGERIPLKISECEMLSIVKDVINDISRKEVSRIRLEGSACVGFWDGDAIRRAIENLLTNALKYGKSGTPITIRIVSENQRVAVSVHNIGDPIPIDEQELLFEVFRRAKAAKTSGKSGWGIGLAFVRGVAESHGGSIGVDSSLETGTTFTLDLPQDGRPYQNAPVSTS